MDNNLKILKAVKAAQRSEEIAKYGKLISMRKTVVKNKKKYSRKDKHIDRSQYDSYFLLSIKSFYQYRDLINIMKLEEFDKLKDAIKVICDWQGITIGEVYVNAYRDNPEFIIDSNGCDWISVMHVGNCIYFDGRKGDKDLKMDIDMQVDGSTADKMDLFDTVIHLSKLIKTNKVNG